jgi:prepilin-type N-terminal cleavage/methylation domain-containing protein
MNEFNSTSVSDRGFTLIEILIAITLLAFITMGVVSVTQNAFDTKDRTTELNKSNLQIETAMSRFEWDFTQIYSPLYFSKIMPLNGADPYAAQPVDANGDGIDDNSNRKLADIQADAQANAQNPAMQEYLQRLQTRFENNENFSGINMDGMPVPRFYSPEKSIFQFFTSSNRRKLENTKQSHYGWVRYQLVDDNDSDVDENKNPKIPSNLKNLVRYFNPNDPYDDKRMDPINGFEANKVKGATLMKDIESMEFQFWDLNRRKWEPSLKNIEQGENIIRGVKITIVHYDSFGEKRTSIRTFRNHWPLVVPLDSPTRPSGSATGSSTQGSGTTGNDDGN